MSHASAFKVHKALQVGTSRATFAIDDDLPAPLCASLAAANGAAPDERLWLTLGALDLWNRAGHSPRAASAAPIQACPPESRRPCPKRAQDALAVLLQDIHPQTRAEFLRLADAHQHYLPPRFLPGALALGTRVRELRELIAPVLGQRGIWLARQNPDWAWAASGATASADLWETGSITERVAALRTVRAVDPQAGLAALAASWASEPPESRASLIACLRVGLGLNDEAFLDSALDDRRKEVRAAAQALLASLPGSALAQRMQARLAPLLRYERRMLGANRLDVSLLEARDKAALRDGIGAAAHYSLGEKAGWLVDMLAVIPPGHWTSSFDLSPAQCLKLAEASDFQHALLRGWASATERTLHAWPADTAEYAAAHHWFVELVGYALANGNQVRSDYPQQFFALAGHMAPTEADAFLLSLLKAAGPAWGKQPQALLDLVCSIAAGSARNWSSALSLTIHEHLCASIGVAGMDWTLRQAFPQLACALEPSAIAAYEKGWPDQSDAWPVWQEPVTQFLNIVRFRHEMALSFQEHAS